MKVSGGLDCAGDQKEYQQRSQLGLDTTHLENGSYVIVSIHDVPDAETESFDFAINDHGFGEHDILKAHIQKEKVDSVVEDIEKKVEISKKCFLEIIEVNTAGF